ncbi:membrane-associated protein [Diaminobutyricimonas aerilata]|uniref:Membrane-associated protein n=1 Tax=Diaminobutyricimonas aerilata TaxID=1162967 RepID=A0A2M9CIC0_9MICO|nr:VTT domain-containing protein [Diaminobutyricimonas aerilata]PJJ71664.1 membrane-associated protein [Diaminobutyricimonas aerilata]
MAPAALIPWLDPETLITAFGPFALLGVCLIVFAETGLLVGFLLPGDTLLIITGLLAFNPDFPVDIWWVCLAIAFAAFLGGEVGYLIGHKAGPRIFERKESGLFSVKNVERTNAFFERFGGLAVIVARFVPIVRTFTPVAAGVGHMNYAKYSLYNAIGALIWGAGLTYGGYLLGYIPPVADFVQEYIDLILLAAVLTAVVPTVFHYIQSSRKARRARTEAAEPVDTASLALSPEYFDQNRENDPKH